MIFFASKKDYYPVLKAGPLVPGNRNRKGRVRRQGWAIKSQPLNLYGVFTIHECCLFNVMNIKLFIKH